MMGPGVQTFVAALAVSLLLAAGAVGQGSLAAADTPGDPAIESHSGTATAEAEPDGDAAAAPSGRYDPRTQPAAEGAYFYRQIGFALAVMGLTVAGLVWLVRRQKRR